MDDPLRLTGRAAGERDQAGVGGLELGRRGPWFAREQGSVRDRQDGAVRVSRCELVGVALIGYDQPGLGRLQAQLQVPGSQLLVTGQRDCPEPKARDHRQHPLRAVADQRQDDVFTADTMAREGAGEPGAAVRDFAKSPLAPAAVTAQLHEREVRGRGCVDDVAGEVQGRAVCQDPSP